MRGSLTQITFDIKKISDILGKHSCVLVADNQTENLPSALHFCDDNAIQYFCDCNFCGEMYHATINVGPFDLSLYLYKDMAYRDKDFGGESFSQLWFENLSSDHPDDLKYPDFSEDWIDCNLENLGADYANCLKTYAKEKKIQSRTWAETQIEYLSEKSQDVLKSIAQDDYDYYNLLIAKANTTLNQNIK